MKPKQIFKKIDKKCYFCEEREALDAHRILYGSRGGKYKRHNTLTICPNCHRKIHDGILQILGRYKSTAGRMILHYLDHGEEKWL